MKKVIILFLYLLWGLSAATAQSQDPWVGTWTSESYKALDSESEGQVYTDFRYVIRISKSEDKYFVRAKTVKVTDPKSAIYNDAYGIKNSQAKYDGNRMLVESSR